MPNATAVDETPLKGILDAEGRSQQWLARTTDIPYGRTSRIVKGLNLPNVVEAHAIARALGREIVDVWSLEMPDSPDPTDVA